MPTMPSLGDLSVDLVHHILRLMHDGDRDAYTHAVTGPLGPEGRAMVRHGRSEVFRAVMAMRGADCALRDAVATSPHGSLMFFAGAFAVERTCVPRPRVGVCRTHCHGLSMKTHMERAAWCCTRIRIRRPGLERAVLRAKTLSDAMYRHLVFTDPEARQRGFQCERLMNPGWLELGPAWETFRTITNMRCRFRSGDA